MALPPRPSHAEIAAAVYASWRLFIGDRGGMSYLGSGHAGFWRACWALAAVLPVNLLMYVVQSLADPEVSLSLGGMARLSMAVVILWYGYALAAHYVLPALDRGDRYYDYMIAEFWTALPAVAIQVLAVLVVSSGLFGETLGNLLTVAAIGASLWLRTQVVRLVLDLNWGMAVGLVLAGLMFHAMVAGVVTRGL